MAFMTVPFYFCSDKSIACLHMSCQPFTVTSLPLLHYYTIAPSNVPATLYRSLYLLVDEGRLGVKHE